MTFTEKIKKIDYDREVVYLGDESSGVTYMKNVVTLKDENTKIRKGIIDIKGNSIKDKAESIKSATELEKNSWWSLQATNLAELKAAYRAGFRSSTLKKHLLKDYVEGFKNNGGTLHMEKNREN